MLRISDVRMYEDTWMDYVSGAAIDRGKLAHVSHRLPPCDQDHNTHAWLPKKMLFYSPSVLSAIKLVLKVHFREIN